MKIKPTRRITPCPPAVLRAALGAVFLGAVIPANSANPPKPAADKDAWSMAVVPGTPASQTNPPNVAPTWIVPPQNASDDMERHTQGRIIEGFHAENLDLKLALALFASQNNLNIVPDNDITGTVTLNVHNLPLDQMMNALLEAGDCSWQEEDGLIRVRSAMTRTFAVDYLRLRRAGTGTSSDTLSSSASSAAGVGSGGSGGGGSGGSGGGGSGGSGGGGGSGGTSSTTSASLTSENPVDFWTELRSELGSLLTPLGKASLAINQTAGIIQITDRPSAIKKVAEYLAATEQSVNRQVDIESRIYDVTLNNEFQFGIDWNYVANAYQGSLGLGTATLPTAIGSAASGLGGSALNGLPISGEGAAALAASGIGNSPVTLAFKNMNTQVAVTALQTQGKVVVIAAPRIRALNNQTAVVKVGQALPFFASSTVTTPTTQGSQIYYNDVVTTISIGTILTITPQISADGWISMDITPVLTALVGDEVSPDKSTTAPELSDKQTSTMVRVHDNTTVVLGGLIQTENDSSQNKVPLLGDIPVLGQLFTGTYHAKSKTELVIFVTPHIVQTGEPSVKYVDSSEDSQPKASHSSSSSSD